MVDIAANIRTLEERIARACRRSGRSPSEITVIAVAKMVAPSAIREAYAAGLRAFGENRVQEAEPKIGELSDLSPRPAWHMIGHLQTNKARAAAELFDMVHSVDSLRVASALDHHATPSPGGLPVLLQVNIAGEATKGGFTPRDANAALREVSRLPNLRVKGLMTIAPLGRDPEEARPVFRRLHLMVRQMGLPELSMGMTDDFEVAIEEGATMIRIGRAIFGERPA